MQGYLGPRFMLCSLCNEKHLKHNKISIFDMILEKRKEKKGR